jgi:Protein of unknown function (DUF2716)
MEGAATGGWEPQSDRMQRRLMQLFADRFSFHPATAPSGWPSINEPAPSLTLDLSSVGSPEGCTIPQADELILGFLENSFAPTVRLAAINYNHFAYWFWPHQFTETNRLWPDSWPVHPYPNGDYSIFLAEEMNQGMFGHPWEKSLCIFGSGPIEAGLALTATWRVIRSQE